VAQRRFWQPFLLRFAEKDSTVLKEEILTKASSYYYVTYKRSEIQLLSFPWMTVPKLLACIAEDNDGHYQEALESIAKLFTAPKKDKPERNYRM